MKLRGESASSYINDQEQLGLLRYLTWGGNDVAFAWIGPHAPATTSSHPDLREMARCNLVHYNFYRTLVKRFCDAPGSALDVGCGSGQRTAMLARYMTEVVGVESDMSKASAAAILNGAPNISWVFEGFTSWAAATPQRFDYIFAVEVIEYVPHEAQGDFIRAMRALARPGGVIMLTTPRDIPPVCAPPHIGLWSDEMAVAVPGELYYFSRLAAETGDALCGLDAATHFVKVIR